MWYGFRAIAYIDDSFTIQSRNAKELRHFFPELQELKLLTKDIQPKPPEDVRSVFVSTRQLYYEELTKGKFMVSVHADIL